MVPPVVFTRSAVLLFAAPVALLSACAPNEPVATTPGTTPPVWTGSPAPPSMEDHGGMTHTGAMPPAAPGPPLPPTPSMR